MNFPFFRKLKPRKKLGLALGSGGTKGLTIIGILETLEKHNIKIDYIAGSSIGSIVGGAYAIDKDIQKIKKFTLDFPNKSLLSSISDIGSKGGLIKGNKFLDTIKRYIKDQKIENLQIPFVAVATDIETGNPVTIDKGDLAEAMRASSSIPIMMQPFKSDDSELIDGGVSQQVPVEIVKKMGADVVIAVNLAEETIAHKKRTGLSSTSYYLNLLIRNLAAENCRDADIVIAPKFSSINLVDNVKNREALIEKGRQAAEEKIPEILALLK